MPELVQYVLRVRADGRPYDPLIHTMATRQDWPHTFCGRPVFLHDDRSMRFPTCFECITTAPGL